MAAAAAVACYNTRHDERALDFDGGCEALQFSVPGPVHGALQAEIAHHRHQQAPQGAEDQAAIKRCDALLGQLCMHQRGTHGGHRQA